MSNSSTMMITCGSLKLPVINSSELVTIRLHDCLKRVNFNRYFSYAFRIYLTSSLFLRLQAISGYPGHVNIMSLFNYTMRKVWLQQTRIGLSLYDYTGQGFLRESVFFVLSTRIFLLFHRLSVDSNTHALSKCIFTTKIGS